MTRGKIDYDRLQQADLTVVAMQIAHEHGGFITTTELKVLMVKKFKPEGIDEAQNANFQKNFEQVVGNIISNGPKMKSSMLNLEYVEFVNNGIKLTDKGRDFLERVPT